MAGATSLIELILKKWGDDIAGAAKELEDKVGFPESVANRIATGELPMDAESVARRADERYTPVRYRGINGEYDPDKAGYYQMFTTSRQDAAEYGDNVIEARLNLGDNAVVDGGGRNFNSIPTEDGLLVRTDELAHAAREAGRDSLTIRNIHDKADNEIPRRPSVSNTGPSDEEIMRELGLDYSPSPNASPAPDARNYDPVDVDVIFDPSRIRSPNAAFDPQYTGSNIMGGAALPVAAGLLAMGQSDDADAGFVTKGGKTLLEAWHGSPHKFDKFSMDQIGTGEGAQAYGHGLYFADSDDVALHYSGGFDDRFTLDGKPYVYPDDMPVELDPDAYDLAVQNTGRYGKEGAIEKGALLGNKGYSDEWIASYNKYVDEVGDRVSFSKTPKGSLYRTEIDVTPESLLDWDAMLDEQPKAVQEAIESSDWWDYAADDLWSRESNPTGGDLVRWLSDDGPEFGSQQLNDRGIKGIKYLDGDSRAVGDGTSNYVIFDDSLINIAERGNADPRLLAGVTGMTAAGLAAPMIKDSGMISAPRSETLFDLTMGARDLERRLEGSPASLLFPSGLVDYLETVNRREEDPNAMTRGMALLDVLPF